MDNDISKIIALNNMGFSEEQIKTIMNIGVQQSGNSTTDDPTTAASTQQVMDNKIGQLETATQPTKETGATVVKESLDNERLNSLEQAIKDLTKATHKAAIQSSSMPEPKEMTILDVMNDLCR